MQLGAVLTMITAGWRSPSLKVKALLFVGELSRLLAFGEKTQTEAARFIC